LLGKGHSPPPPARAPLLWLRPAPLGRDSALPHRPFFNTTVSSLPSFDQPQPSTALIRRRHSSHHIYHSSPPFSTVTAPPAPSVCAPFHSPAPFAARAVLPFPSPPLSRRMRQCALVLRGWVSRRRSRSTCSALPFCSCFVTSIRGMGSESHAYAKHRP
jgi:hypothetical protein